jgi:hypothetical protein
LGTYAHLASADVDDEILRINGKVKKDEPEQTNWYEKPVLLEDPEIADLKKKLAEQAQALAKLEVYEDRERKTAERMEEIERLLRTMSPKEIHHKEVSGKLSF